jgi:hypothetical protein
MTSQTVTTITEWVQANLGAATPRDFSSALPDGEVIVDGSNQNRWSIVHFADGTKAICENYQGFLGGALAPKIGYGWSQKRPTGSEPPRFDCMAARFIRGELKAPLTH